MSQAQSTISASQPSTTTLPIDPTPLLESNSPTAIILAIAILLWVLRPVMLLQKSGSSNRKN
ncbi:MAG: hypothetical protein KME25_13770 [Symplocastrum torsivum CPER-KK1]|jgi:hypothetical protein|uniref:Uncharacterized protein n=1 Tax=Symplocastrum torsivum CPER-KK1 TaxID=450513 RepID=A0A951PKU6_9CYAN|nr:hypothetical protein [Symplocastrum torsivum CPER-KK1]